MKKQIYFYGVVLLDGCWTVFDDPMAYPRHGVSYEFANHFVLILPHVFQLFLIFFTHQVSESRQGNHGETTGQYNALYKALFKTNMLLH